MAKGADGMNGTCAGCRCTTQDMVTDKWRTTPHYDGYLCPECVDDDTLEFVEELIAIAAKGASDD